MKRNIFLFAVAVSFIAVGCLKDQAAQVKTVVVPTAGVCDTITYTKHIQPLMTTYCATPGCHVSNNAPRVPLTTYAEVSLEASSIDNHVYTIQDMPLGATMSAKELQQLRCWLDNGKKQ